MKIKNIFKPKPPSKHYLYYQQVVRKYLENDKVLKLISPKNEEYYLLNEQDKIAICVSLNGVEISQIDGVSIKEKFELRLLEKLIKQIQVAIELDRKKVKERFFNSQIAALQKIIKL